MDIYNSAYFVAQEDKIQKLIEPLRKHGIDFFGCGRFYDDGRYYYFTNAAYIPKYILESNSLLVTKIEEKYIKPNIHYLIPMDGYYKGFLQHLKAWHPYDIIHRQLGYFDFYCFAGFENRIYLPNFYLHEASVLEDFIKNFRIKAKPLLDEAELNMDFLPEEFRSNVAGLEIKETGKLKRFYLGSGNTQRYLTGQEMACLSHLIRGDSARMIADTLSLSKRTVESYFDCAKDRLGCLDNRELMSNFIDSDLVDLTIKDD